MTDSARSRQKFWAARVLEGMRENFSTLPNDKEKQEIQMALKGLRDYFDRVEDELNRIPSEEERTKIAQALEVLLQLFKKAESSPLYSSILGMPRQRSSGRPFTASVEEEAKVESKQKELMELPTDAIMSKLMDEDYISKSQLIVLARKLRVVVSGHMSRAEVADRVFKRAFANPRGYAMLGGRSKEQSGNSSSSDG